MLTSLPDDTRIPALENQIKEKTMSLSGLAPWNGKVHVEAYNGHNGRRVTGDEKKKRRRGRKRSHYCVIFLESKPRPWLKNL